MARRKETSRERKERKRAERKAFLYHSIKSARTEQRRYERQGLSSAARTYKERADKMAKEYGPGAPR